jgi:hypothetical protein
MKKLLLLFVLLTPLLTKAQDLREYTANNGVVYHLNDTVRLGYGSGPNGAFQYILEKGGAGNPYNIKRGKNKRSEVIIRFIKKGPRNGTDSYFFIVDGGVNYRFLLYIDEAIAACEVTPCSSTPGDKKP